MRSMLLVSALVLCAVALFGCEKEAPVTREELIGTYRSGSGDVMTLRADGRVRLESPHAGTVEGAWKMTDRGEVQFWLCGKPDPETQCTGSSVMPPSRRGQTVVFDTGDSDRERYVKQDE